MRGGAVNVRQRAARLWGRQLSSRTPVVVPSGQAFSEIYMSPGIFTLLSSARRILSSCSAFRS